MLNLKRHLRNEKGFTMIEMMVVLIIIGVLIAGGIFMYIRYVDKAKLTKAKGEVTTMAAALDSYYAENGEYPAGDQNDASVITGEMRNAGLPEGRNDNGTTTGKLPKDPWGVCYEYRTTTDTYTLTAKDNKGNERVVASGNKGETTITTGSITTP